MSWIEDPGVEQFDGLNLRDLRLDEAYVRVKSDVDKSWLYTLSDECYKCPFKRREDFSALKPDYFLKYNTRHSEKWRLYSDGASDAISANNTNGLLCEVETDFGEFGVYDLSLQGSSSDNVTCSLTTAKQPVNIYFPLLIWFLAFLVIILIWASISQLNIYLKKRAKKRYIVPTSQLHNLETPTPEPQLPELPAPKPGRIRLKSLDTFRGIALVMMVFVNFGAGDYWFLEHATWNGLQLADLLFPWFMWIMGVCIPISIRSQLKRNVSRCQIFTTIFRRSLILFILGIMLNTVGGANRLETLRIFGVLQRFGLVYFVVATMGLLLTCRDYSKPNFKPFAAMQDVIVLLPQWVLVGGLTAAHTVLILTLEVPGCPTGYLGPGGVHEGGVNKDCIGGFTGYADQLVLGREHIYQYPTANDVYQSGPFDPEGLFGCLTSILQVFLGVQAGSILLFHEGVKGRVIRWTVWGVMTGIAGGVLCLASKEDGWIPVNKNLWSVSYVLVTSCFAYFLLIFCYLLVDVKKWWSGAPFFYPGMNSTIVYVGHSVAYSMLPWHFAYGPMNTHFLRLTECLWGTALWVVVAYWLFRVKFFLTI